MVFKPVFALALLAALAACTDPAKKAPPFDGIYFKAKARAVDKKVTRSVFTVEVKRATQSVEGAREAGRYEATRYCIENYGTSDIIWAVGPDSAALTLAGDALILKGTCDT